jgi:regulator of protease activity HflC (stomatin/prohibitin superfamily)
LTPWRAWYGSTTSPGAAQNIAATTLRSVVGDMTLDDVLSKRELMNEQLRSKLDESPNAGA